MKKLIAISVVFALAAGVAFAVDLGGTVNTSVNVIKTDFNGGSVDASAQFETLRLEGAGEAGEGKFGGWIRLDPAGLKVDGTDVNFNPGVSGIAWWKPIDQFKLSVGGNPDGLFGKDGFSGWSLNQKANDGIAIGKDNIWGWGETVKGLMHRFAFFGGFDDNRVYMEIKPFDMLGINVAIPFFKNTDIVDVLKGTIAQLDLNFDFGNIAFTYRGDAGQNGSAMYLYYGGSFGDLGLDFGVSYHFEAGNGGLWINTPLYIGLGLKYTAGAFGIKFRSGFGIPIEDGNPFKLLVDLVPYFVINDNIAVFLNAGIGMAAPKTGDATVGWYVNPYVRVGAEWGPSFYAGIQVGTDHDDNNVYPDKIKFAIPIAIMVGF
jgi:hypothetical protein